MTLRARVTLLERIAALLRRYLQSQLWTEQERTMTEVKRLVEQLNRRRGG